MIKCNKCNQSKDESEFYFRKDTGSYRKSCKSCIKAAKAIRESEPGVKELRANKEKERRRVHKERINAKLKEQRYGTKEKRLNYLKRLKEWRKTEGGVKSYQKTLLSKRTTYSDKKETRTVEHLKNLLAVRRNRYKKCNPDAPISALEEYIEEFIPTTKFCRYCGTPCESSWTLDHIIPVVQGGDNTVENLVIACRSCNSSKNKKSLIHWLAYNQKLKNLIH